MIAYKAFKPGLICLGFQFVMGPNFTEKANCRANGFHCAENPLDCLSYYPNIHNSVFCVVDARGDIDEDGDDSKIACTELAILKQLSLEEFFLHGLAYMADHPLQKWSHTSEDFGEASGGYVVVRGHDPVARGRIGDILAFAKEGADGKKITQISLTSVDGKKAMPDVWYGVDLTERQVGLL